MNETMTTKEMLKVGDKVRFEHPGHCCSNKPNAKVYSLDVPFYPDLISVQLENGVICNCQPSRLTKVK